MAWKLLLLPIITIIMSMTISREARTSADRAQVMNMCGFWLPSCVMELPFSLAASDLDKYLFALANRPCYGRAYRWIVYGASLLNARVRVAVQKIAYAL